MLRRLLYLYFPCLALDRLQREDAGRRLRPFGVTREEKGHCYIAEVNTFANRAGIRHGIRLTDARAILPDLEALPDDPEANTKIKQRLIEWCGRYSPLVADDGVDGIVLDIAGCAHLFNGEAALLRDLQSRIRKTGYHLRGSIAGTLGAAWALARYAKQVIVQNEELPAVLDSLPIEGLRLPGETASELGRLGLTTIAALRKIPRQSLVTRYGTDILLRLDQAFGQVEEPIHPHRPAPSYRAERMLSEPIGTVNAVEYILLQLVKDVCLRMEKDHVAARRLNLDCYRVDGTITNCYVITSNPVRATKHLMRLFSDKLGSLDAGFGIEVMVLSVPDIEPFDPVQISLKPLESRTTDDTAIDGLVDRLGMRLGFQKICRFHICESWLPECAVQFYPITVPVTSNAIWPQYRLRPVQLLSTPIHIEVTTMLPDESPVQFRIGSQLHRIVNVDGPERLLPEWWRNESVSWEKRDYYRVEDDHGSRFWIFREIKSLSRSSPLTRWFLQGYLP